MDRLRVLGGAIMNVYFLENVAWSTENSIVSGSKFFVGPYRTEEDARRRGEMYERWLKERLQGPRVRALRARPLNQGKLLVEETRIFGRASFVHVNSDGSIAKDAQELHFPDDYFDSTAEFV